jgi:PRELI-like family
MSYNPHPSDPNKTLLKQEAVISVQGVPLTSYIEDMLTNRVSSNAGKVKCIKLVFSYFKT